MNIFLFSVFFLLCFVLVLVLESQYKGSNAPSIRSLVVDEDDARPLVGVSALRSLQCFDTVSWVTGMTFGP